MASDTSLLFRILAKDEASQVLDGVQQKMDTVSQATGAAAAAALGAGLVQYLDVTAAGDKLQAQLGIGADKAAKIAEVSARIYEDAWGESTLQVNDAISAVYKNIGDTSKAEGGLQGVTTKVLALANTFNQDLNMSTAAVGQMLRTGLAKNADEALDILTVGFQSSANKADDLLETLNEYGTQFRKLGVDGRQATGILNQGLKAGARDADIVADALKEFSIRAVDGSKKTADGFKMLGLSGKEMSERIGKGGKSANAALDVTLDRLRAIKDPVKRSQAAVALFGTQAEDLGDALYALDPSSAVTALGKVGGAADRMAKTLSDSPAAAIEEFKRKALGKLAEISGAMAVFALDNQNVLIPIVATLGGVAAAITVVNLAMKAWAATQAAWKAIQVAATAVQWAWNAALTANPIGLIIVAIAALIGIVILAYKKNETFRKIVQASWKAIKSAVSATAEWIAKNVPPVWRKITAAASATWRWIKTYIPPLARVMFKPYQIAWSVIRVVWQRIRHGASATVNMIRSMPGRIRSAFSSLVNTIVGPFRRAFNTVISLYNRMASRMHVSVPGWVPGIGGESWSVPTIPALAKGGIARTSGLALVGERGPEIAFLSRGAGIAPLGALGGSGRTVLEVRASGDDVSRLLAELIKRYVRVAGGGSVQQAFGRG